MPKQNRVNPFGQLISTDARGAFMGNRGVLHDNNGQLTHKRWTHPHWIICLLDFKDRKRPLMSPGCYTELFFMDEATALAAGHRPCAECRRVEFNLFKAAWLKGNASHGFGHKVSIGNIDNILQQERVSRDRQKLTFEAFLRDLPDGVFVSIPGQTDNAWLIWKRMLYRWSPDGYSDPSPWDGGQKVTVLTPKSIVGAIANGYEPQVAHIPNLV